MGIASVLDKAGPALASGIVLAILSAAGASALAWSRLDSVSGVRWAWVTEQITDLRGQCGSRESQIHQLEERVREQETRPPRLNPALEQATSIVHENKRVLSVLEEKVRALENRVVGIGPGGWHRADHDTYAKMVEAQLAELETRLQYLEKRK